MVWGGKNNNSDLIYCTCFDLSRLASRSALGGVWYSILLWAVCLSPQTHTWTLFGGVFDPRHHSSRPLSLTFTLLHRFASRQKPRCPRAGQRPSDQRGAPWIRINVEPEVFIVAKMVSFNRAGSRRAVPSAEPGPSRSCQCFGLKSSGSATFSSLSTWKRHSCFIYATCRAQLQMWSYSNINSAAMNLNVFIWWLRFFLITLREVKTIRKFFRNVRLATKWKWFPRLLQYPLTFHTSNLWPHQILNQI